MKITETTPSEQTGIKLTEEIFNTATHLCELAHIDWMGGEGSQVLRKILKECGVTDFNRYEHYYGFNKPID